MSVTKHTHAPLMLTQQCCYAPHNTCTHARLHTYIPTYLPTYIPTHLPTYIAYRPTYLHACKPTALHTEPTYLQTYTLTERTGFRTPADLAEPTDLQKHKHAYMHVCTHTHIHTYMHTCIHTHEHTYTGANTHTYTRRGTHTHTHKHVHTSQARSCERCIIPGNRKLDGGSRNREAGL